MSKMIIQSERLWLILQTTEEVLARVADPARISAHGDTALFFDCADVDAACAHLRSKGIDVSDPVIRDYGMKQLYLRDPDGYEICFQRPIGIDADMPVG